MSEGDYDTMRRDWLLYGSSYWLIENDVAVHVPIECCKPFPTWDNPSVIEVINE